jgi:hypothetical protein
MRVCTNNTTTQRASDTRDLGLREGRELRQPTASRQTRTYLTLFTTSTGMSPRAIAGQVAAQEPSATATYLVSRR